MLSENIPLLYETSHAPPPSCLKPMYLISCSYFSRNNSQNISFVGDCRIENIQRGKLQTTSSCQPLSIKMSSTCTFVVTRKPRMGKNRFPRKREPLSHSDDGLLSSIYSRISTTTSNGTKMARASTIIITSVEASSSRSTTNTDTWIFDGSSTRRARKWSSRPNREYV